MGSGLAINWRYFSLEQVNSQQGLESKIWEQPADYQSRGLNAFRAAEAARRQGEAAFSAFHIALLKARHEERLDIANKKVLKQVAGGAGLDMTRFERDLNAPDILERLAEDHTHAIETLGVFGTPTLVFPGNQAVFLKMLPPPPEDSLSIFDEVRNLNEHRQYILEIKRPQPPARK